MYLMLLQNLTIQVGFWDMTLLTYSYFKRQLTSLSCILQATEPFYAAWMSALASKKQGSMGGFEQLYSVREIIKVLY